MLRPPTISVRLAIPGFRVVNIWIKRTAPLLVLGLGIGTFMLLEAFKPEPEKKEEGPRPITVFVERIEPVDLDLEVVTQG